MSFVLVDTSVWIDYINQRVDFPEVQKLDSLLSLDTQVCLCPIVYQEILQGIRDEKMFLHVKNLLNAFPMLIDDFPLVEDTAIDLYRSLRRQGVTIRKSNDCLIAAYALVHDMPVLFKDRDFSLICEHSAVRAY